MARKRFIRRPRAVLFAFFLAAASVTGVAAQDVIQPQGSETWLQVSGITEAGPPRIYNDLVVFSYAQEGYARYVAAAFAHEDFGQLHVFSARKLADDSDLFYLAYPVTLGQADLEYRLIVDGVWLTDPHAPERIQDERGVALGRVPLNDIPVYQRTSPQHHANGITSFQLAFDVRIAATLETVTQRRLAVRSFQDPDIYVVGTFNGWDPFADRLVGPDQEGFYHLSRPIPSGTHFYYYIIDGERILDPLNTARGRDLQTGSIVSHMVVP